MDKNKQEFIKKWLNASGLYHKEHEFTQDLDSLLEQQNEIKEIDNCPFCKSDNVFSFVMKHHKCKKCDERWDLPTIEQQKPVLNETIISVRCNCTNSEASIINGKYFCSTCNRQLT